MSCGFCLEEYDPLSEVCAHCMKNPQNTILVDNFKPCYISLTNKDFEIDSLLLDPTKNWSWDLIPDKKYNHYVYDLTIYTEIGITLTRKVTVTECRWKGEKHIIISDRFNLPISKLRDTK